MVERRYIAATRGELKQDPWGRSRPAERIRGVFPTSYIDRLKADGWQVIEERATPGADLEERLEALIDALASQDVIGQELADQLRRRQAQQSEE